MKYFVLCLVLFTTGRCCSTGFLTTSYLKQNRSIGIKREIISWNRSVSRSSSSLRSTNIPELENIKLQLIQTCNLEDIKRSEQIDIVRSKVKSLEDLSKELDQGQFTTPGTLSGEWYGLFLILVSIPLVHS